MNTLMYNKAAQWDKDIAELFRYCDEIVAERRANPDPFAKDLLNNMILDKDPKTGESLSDENIRFQVITFLIAGHETTSGMLSFVMYYMLKNPEVYGKAREEADRVIAEAGGNMTKINANNLKYIDAVCKESLRLQPTAPAWSVTPISEKGETLPGGYHIPHGMAVAMLLPALHRDPKAWGPDAEEFRPERFLDGASIMPDAWKPFGNGQRACIGRGFAMQEAVIAIALIVSRFDLEMADKNYDLTIRQTLTIKPDNFQIIAHPRHNRHQSLIEELCLGGTTLSGANGHDEQKEVVANGVNGDSGHKLYVFYGSNSGSCEGLAREIESEGGAKGFNVVVDELDSAVGGGMLPSDAPVIIVTASYEGKPTDNARMFVDAIGRLPDDALKGVKYVVLGAGHHDWEATFHKVPKYIDAQLSKLGGERLASLMLADAGGDIVGDFDHMKLSLWKELTPTANGNGHAKEDEKAAASTIRILPPTANAAQFVALDGVGTVVSNDVILSECNDTPKTNYITIKLPEGQTYRAGDYLAVLPKNPAPTVDRALKRYGLKGEESIILDVPTSFLPTNVPLRARDLLSCYVELGQPIPRRLLPQLEAFTDEAGKAALQALDEQYAEKVTKQRLSLLDVMDTVNVSPPIAFFLANLPKMKIRQYSVSSTPLENPHEVTLTYTVHTGSVTYGETPDANQYALGVASNYLAFLEPGDDLLCSVKSSADFHLPADPTTPVVMFAAGSGVAPFRGFIAERAAQRKAGRDVGPTVLYFGTRRTDTLLHSNEIAQWVEEGVLDFRPVLSREQGGKAPAFSESTVLTTGYVQDRVWEDRDFVRGLFKDGALLYTCGSGARLGQGLRRVLVQIIGEAIEVAKSNGKEVKETAEEMYERLAKDRYRTDVFL